MSLPMSARVVSGYSGPFPESKDMPGGVKLIWNSKFPVGVNLGLNVSLAIGRRPIQGVSRPMPAWIDSNPPRPSMISVIGGDRMQMFPRGHRRYLLNIFCSFIKFLGDWAGLKSLAEELVSKNLVLH